ncbi:MAG: endospore germination permease [Pelosinus sp.]|nr:endospore germination permease [Pelosinus sp.]
MTNSQKISPRQAIFLLSLSRISIVLLWFHFSNQDVWITEIIALFYIAIFCTPLLFLSKQFANLTPIEYLPIITGKLVGKILGALYFGFFLFVATMDLSLFDNILKPINFPETPDYAIVLLALITCAYGANKGLECIARTTEIFVPQILTIIVLYATLQIPDMDFKVFLPILADSTFSEINFQSFNIAAGIHEIIILAMLVPSINKKETPNMIFFWAIILITVFSLIIIVPTLAGLGLELSQKTFDPYYLFIKQINIYDFITRIEFFIVGAWNIGMFVKISLFLYLATISLVQVLGLRKRKVLIIPLAIVLFITALKTNILKSVIVFHIIEYYVPYINLIFMFVIPVVALVMFFLKKTINAKSNCNS